MTKVARLYLSPYTDSGSPSPSKTLSSMSSSPARIQSLRHQAVQNQALENATSTNGIANNPMFHQMQMNFDYNQNPNPNGLELAGFCSPSGRSAKAF